MDVEETFVAHILNTRFDDLPEQAIAFGKTLLLTVLGTTIAGARTAECEAAIEQVREWGGRKEATVLIYGGQVPAHNAAFVNSMMARALDFCDGMIPGLHLGSTAVPTALAAAELTGGCNGKDFLTYLVVGTEAAARINACSTYDGFDPTGVCSIFAATAICGRMLHLNPEQMLHALALTANRSGGSFQGNLDGAGSVWFIQGSASQGGILCAQLAKKGITGPRNFLKGPYGYFHLFGEEAYNQEALFGRWGERFESHKLNFKRYPSCWNNTTSIDAMLELIRERGLTPEDVDRITIAITPHQYRLVGHPFDPGDNPRVKAQFNVRYCVASALLRKDLRIEDFDGHAIKDPRILEIIERIEVIADPDLVKQGPNAACIRVKTKGGMIYENIVRLPHGSQASPLTREEHVQHYNKCLSYANNPTLLENAEKILSMVSQLEELPDVCAMIPLLLSP